MVRTLLAMVAAIAFAAHATAAEPGTMKAVRMHDFGGPEVLKYEDVPKPAPGPGEVLVRVKAAGINPVDWKLRDGMGRSMLKPPFTLGFDVSGVVDAVDPTAKDFKPGDEVFAYLALARGGGYAEYAVVPAKDLAKKPAKIDHIHAAAVPLAALTAWQGLFDHAKLQAGQTVLIHGGAGGVGHFAVQLAAAKGIKVITTSSAQNVEFVKSLGAQTVIDYKSQKFEDIAKDLDAVFDMIGGDTLERSYQCLKEGGYIVSIVAAPDQAKLAAKKAKGSRFLVQPDAKQLSQIAALIDDGKLKPDVSATFDLQDAGKAQELSKSGGTGRGKIVLSVPDQAAAVR